jgi:lipopolysaccharide export system permease protein
MIKKLDKFIFKNFIGTFILTLSVIVFIFLIQTLLKYIDQIVGKDLGWEVYSELFFYFALNTLPMSAPLAVLLAALISFGNLGQHSELTAIKGSGISLIRVMASVFFFVLILSGFLYVFNNTVVPMANLKAFSLLYDVTNKKPGLELKEGAFYNGIPGYSIKVSKKFEDGHSLKGVMIYDHTKGRGNTDVVVADSGNMYTFGNGNYLALELFNGHNYSEYTEGNAAVFSNQFIQNKFKKTKIVFSLSSFALSRTKEDLFRSNRWMKNQDELSSGIDSMNRLVDSAKFNTKANLRSFYVLTLFPENREDPNKPYVIPGWVPAEVDPFLKDKKAATINQALAQTRNIRTMLLSNQDKIDFLTKEADYYAVTYWQKFTQTFTCLVFFLIGAPLGAIIRKGGLGVPVIITVCFFVVYYALTMTGERLAKSGAFPAEIISWLANAILLPIGLYFMWQAKNDARLFDSDFYAVLFDKVRNKFSKKKQINT